jgi:hypothetical protein
MRRRDKNTLLPYFLLKTVPRPFIPHPRYQPSSKRRAPVTHGTQDKGESDDGSMILEHGQRKVPPNVSWP